MGVRIIGMDNLKRKLGKLPAVIEDAVYEATFEIVEDIQGRAESKLQSSMKYSQGELGNSLKNEVVKDRTGNIVGRVWSDNMVALFREMGTGQVGQASQKDLPPGMNPVYTQEPWFFPVDSVDIDLNAIYGMPIIKIQGKEFYRTNGQPARPFLYPALKEGTENAADIYKQHIQKSIRGGLN